MFYFLQLYSYFLKSHYSTAYFYLIHQNSVNPSWVQLLLLNFKLLTINYRIIISFRPEPEKNLTYVQQIKKKTFQGKQLSHGTTQTRCLLITPITEDLRKPLPHSRPTPVPLTWKWTFTLCLLCFSKKTFLGVCDYLKLSQVQRFKRYHQVFSSLSQKQISDTRQRRTKFHYIEISLSLWTYENNYSSAPKRLAQSCSWIWVLFRHVRVWTLLFKHHFKKNCAIRVLSLSMHLSLSTQKLIMANFTKEEPKYIIS